jgi:uncharacterized protein (DUF1684 family)
VTISTEDALTLLDWKRRIFDLYAEVRRADDPGTAWKTWVETRDEMYRTHPQSPVPAASRSSYEGSYFDYDGTARVLGELHDAEPLDFEIPTSGTEPMHFTRIGTCDFELQGTALALEVYWLSAYAGGLFVPFRDQTSGTSTYGAGRYLLDTVKGSDLGTHDGKLVLDFNFSYNPSCAYDARWVCPLAPPPNRLDIAIEAGERTPAPTAT